MIRSSLMALLLLVSTAASSAEIYILFDTHKDLHPGDPRGNKRAARGVCELEADRMFNLYANQCHTACELEYSELEFVLPGDYCEECSYNSLHETWTCFFDYDATCRCSDGPISLKTGVYYK